MRVARGRPPSALFWASLGASLALHGGVVAAVLWPGLAEKPAEAPLAQTFAGDTFELPGTVGAPAVLPPELDEAPAPVVPPEPPATFDPTAAAAPPPRAPSHASKRTHRPNVAAQPAVAGGSAAAPPAAYGAVGDRSAMDLATAFTRAFPGAASGDPQWAHVPFGGAGTAELTFVLDDTGALKDTRIDGAASPALVAGIRRTLALIHSRSFTARGASTRLSVRAVVAPDEAHDGLHGDVFAVGAGFQGREGTAFFALAIGRRIDIHVSERR